jgi:ATP-binding cassette subfamily F protein 3
MDSRSELIHALNQYEGAVLVISHDRNLLESVVDRLWLVDKGTVKSFDGSLEDYRQFQIEKSKPPRKTKSKSVPDPKAARKASADARAKLAPLKKRAEKIETEISGLQTRLAEVDSLLADPNLYTTDQDRALELSKERGTLEKQIGQLEDSWLEALDAFETAKAENA